MLHSSHQGITSMEHCAREMNESTRSCCIECCRNAPSQAALPAAAQEIPSTPFEAIFTDFFEESGYQYLFAGDRLSGWVEVYFSQVSSN